MGGPSRTPGEAASALEEAVDVIRPMWSDERSVRHAGRHYHLAGVHPGPRPVHPMGRIDEGAAEVGREPATVRRVRNVFGTVTDGPSGGFLTGPPRQWTDELTEPAVEFGMDTLVFGTEADDPAPYHRRAVEIAPAVRETVARHRARPRPVEVIHAGPTGTAWSRSTGERVNG
ncbi:N5,N10-methylene tetrahydromethanopterin reductase [Embleya hyalina]|uniref:N5,N10-methylene tetrahydromethanopterin reductase n=2 Tax=Embleya hyalina TaxID=516124 RepID=A0A401YCT5_9ACTN|nr:N5,N10-methylene tetrahydromethanopterin reductase [Embleya hyalina]